MKKYSTVTVTLAPQYIATNEDVKTMRTLEFIIRLPDATGLDCMNALYNAVMRWKQKTSTGQVNMMYVVDTLLNDPDFEPYLDEEGIVTISMDNNHVYANPGVYYSEMKI